MQPLTGSSSSAVQLYDEALSCYLDLRGDPIGLLKRAISEDPSLLAGHLLIAALYLLSTGHGGCEAAVLRARRAGCEAVQQGAASPREVALVLAIEALSAGRWRLATRVLEAQLAAEPCDALLLRMLHDAYFFLGDSSSLRDSPARSFQAWDPTMPGFGRVCGMLAFGLEETGQLARAEDVGMMALNLDPLDVWALHAVVHVHETGGRLEEGRQLLKEMEEHWSTATLFDRHLHWHWALMSLQEGAVGYRSALTR
jgi:hypothetical protein